MLERGTITLRNDKYRVQLISSLSLSDYYKHMLEIEFFYKGKISHLKEKKLK